MSKNKNRVILNIFSLLFLVVLPIILGFYSIGNSIVNNQISSYQTDVVWYVENNNGDDYVLNKEEKIDVDQNERYVIYTNLNEKNEIENTLYVFSHYQLIKVYVDETLIFTNDTSSTRFFGKTEESKMHLITLPNEVNGKKLSIEYVSPYKTYSGKVSGLEIGTRSNLINKLISKHVFPLLLSMLFVCATLALFITSFFFLKEYKIFIKMNNLLCACLFLSLFFFLESKLITLFIDLPHTVISYLFLIVFNLFILKYLIKEKEGKKEKIIPIIFLILNALHLVACCILQLLDILDIIQGVPITLILQNLILFYNLISKFIEVIKNRKKIKEDKILLLEFIFITALLITNIIVFNIDFTNIDIYLLSGGVFIIYIYIRYSLSIRFVVNEAKKSVEYESELKETKNYLINSQMKSHFVFNTLGAIRTMIVSHPKMAYDMTTDFTKYLRANISNTNSTDLIPFTQELDHIKAYLNIETKRFPNRLNIKFDINTTDFLIPPLSVEPLVENAVKHGVCKKIKGGIVKIVTKEDKDHIYIIVEDDGAGFDVSSLEEASKKGSVGLRYIKTRLKQLANADFEIVSQVKVGTKATITIKK